MATEDTIVAVATPPGRGGLGVIRLSGDRALEIASTLIRLSSSRFENQRATLGEFIDPESGAGLDQVVVTCFRRPHSYTTEDVVEISCHGAPVILRYLVECCLACGARAAEPGEFTMRAFLNGRIDLTQAEAIRDLIESRTLYQARVAAQQIEGALSRRLQPQKKALIDLMAKLEAGIDFAEDDVPVSGWDDILASMDEIQHELERLVSGYAYGRIVHEGLSLAIVGRPNVGKSSLFNRLLNEDRAIVTPVPGTTRDLVTESASIGGIPLRFVDTAGIREAHDEVEAIGVERSLEALADSDLRLLVLDGSQSWTEEDRDLLGRIRPLGALVVALNKSDLPPSINQEELERLLRPDEEAAPVAALLASPPPLTGDRAESTQVRRHTGAGIAPSKPSTSAPAEIVSTSALTGEGISELKEKILEVAAPGRQLASEGEFITSLRHQRLLKDSLAAFARARQGTIERVPHEMLLIDLYDALHSLDAITGATTVDNLLGVIFSTFCVGK